jgi:hypothetical protein
VHWLKVGTSEAVIGLADFGRGWLALATLAITITPTAQSATASGSAILFLMDI